MDCATNAIRGNALDGFGRNGDFRVYLMMMLLRVLELDVSLIGLLFDLVY